MDVVKTATVKQAIAKSLATEKQGLYFLESRYLNTGGSCKIEIEYCSTQLQPAATCIPHN